MAAHQAPLSMGFPRQEYSSRFPFPSQCQDQNHTSCHHLHWGKFFATEPLGQSWCVCMCVCVCVCVCMCVCIYTYIVNIFACRDKTGLKNCSFAWLLSHALLFATPWTVPSRLLCPWDLPGKRYWSGLLFPPSRELLHPRNEPTSPALVCKFFTPKPKCYLMYISFSFADAIAFYSSYSEIFVSLYFKSQ